jgi:hypothetical protein
VAVLFADEDTSSLLEIGSFLHESPVNAIDWDYLRAQHTVEYNIF